MNYKIEYDIDLIKVLARVPKHDAKFIKEKIEKLAENPRPYGSIKLSGKELYRIRHGSYRIIYKIFDHKLIVIIINIGNRNEIYKSL